jgi:hypothetical protein
MRAIRLLPALAAAAALLGPATASGQALAPSLTVDTNYAFSGIAPFDFEVGEVAVDAANGAAIDAALGRHYAVGRTEPSPGDGKIAVVARRSDGELDTAFTSDTGAFATDIVVLPNGHLRILGGTDSGSVVLLGRLPSGQPDPSFGDPDGSVTITVGTGDAVPARMALDEAGRIAIAGYTDTVGGKDAFVSVHQSDGTPLGLGEVGGLGDQRGVDVAWRPAGPVVLVQNGGKAQLHAFDANGAPDAAFAANVPDTIGTEAGGLIAYGGRLWATGATDAGGDTDALVARVNAEGSGLQSRKFDMRGTAFPGGQQVSSRGLDLDVVRGEPDTLVVVGSALTDRPKWGAAAFNGLDGDLAAMQAADAVLHVDGGEGKAVAVAAGANGVAALAGTVELDSGNSSIGMARLLVDAEKQCDLALSIPRPLELVLRGSGPSAVTLVARNGGKRACGGSISVPAPYSMSPATLETGKLAPGQSVTLGASVSRPAPFPVEDTLAFTLNSPTDVAQGDNVARVHVAFMFCDLRLVATGAPRFIGTEGTRLFGFSVRNAGTETCRATSIGVTGQGARTGGGAERYTVPAGQSVTDELRVRLRRRGARPGQRALIAFTAQDAAELLPGDDVVAHGPMVVRPGDSRARRPTGGRRFSGTAENGRARGVRKRMLRLDRVEIAVRKAGKGCLWLSSRAGDLRRVTPGRGGACDEPVWVRAKGNSDWSLRLRRKLPKGRYTLFTRAVTRNGVAEGDFGFRDGNMRRFRLR